MFLVGLLVGCTGGSSPAPNDVVRQLYAVRMTSRMTGAPTPTELAAMTPYLSAELVTLLRQARELHDADVARAPNEKPAFAEGDLFSSLFEGPSALEVVGDSAVNGEHHLAVRFTYDLEQPVVHWIDHIAVIRERGRFVVADVQYGGAWDFANRGTLVSSLRGTVAPPP